MTEINSGHFAGVPASSDEDSEYPLVLNPAFVRPMPESMWGLACARCDKVQSKWELHEQVQVGDQLEVRKEFLPLCALCFLYESNWGQRRRKRLDHLIEEIEQSLGSKFVMDIGGRLAFAAEGDRVLAAIALSSRFAFSMTERIMMEQGKRD